MTDKSFAAVAAEYRAWQETRYDDLAQAEARIDSLLAALFAQSRILAAQEGELVHRAAIITHQARINGKLEAEIARLRTDPARTPTERLVDRMNALYRFEKE